MYCLLQNRLQISNISDNDGSDDNFQVRDFSQPPHLVNHTKLNDQTKNLDLPKEK